MHRENWEMLWNDSAACGLSFRDALTASQRLAGAVLVGLVVWNSLHAQSALAQSTPPRSSAVRLVSEMTPISRSASASADPAGMAGAQVGAVADVAWHGDLDSGWRTARASNRPMLIFITSDDCVYCDAMKRNTLCDQSVLRRLSQQFVPVVLRRGTNTEELQRITVTTYPTTLVAIPQGKVVGHRIGYQPPESFHALLSEVIRPVQPVR